MLFSSAESLSGSFKGKENEWMQQIMAFGLKMDSASALRPSSLRLGALTKTMHVYPELFMWSKQKTPTRTDIINLEGIQLGG